MSRQRSKTFSETAGDSLEKVAEFRPKVIGQKPDVDIAAKIAAESGFVSKGINNDEKHVPSTPIFDARCLKKTNRTAQVNIAVSPATKDRFWRYAHSQGCRFGEEAIIALLNSVYEAN